ncbi:hypothetical protein SeMB42_g04324 [Synchytrium endobioticum]|uniref:Uncharacterized protein n=1 Tax=Synchytrium endobioticum TaxID=286115 RepID=A0A507CZ26_9FUNG|nr:hypothetical protein SeLEV6574_g06613 [Synchytrium endobioticum]TPX44417.1 hypothetical protein SeMB42_g04332 [Synchytrium endobioticum]TPX44423.1 hypothetical protein SeMB42_g04324 [Synchytrium endobioticum]
MCASAVNTATVHIAGAVLAMLQFDMLNEEREIDGFLLGHVETRTVNEISDHARDASQRQETRIIVTGHIPSSSSSWHDAAGRIDYAAMADLVGTNPVLGYFRFRRNTRLQVSLREAAIYDSLRERPTEPHGNARTHQLLCILTALPTNPSTLTLDFAFFTKPRSTYVALPTFRRLPLVVGNLVQSATTQYAAFVSTIPLQSPLGTHIETLELGYVEEYVGLYRSALAMLLRAGADLCMSENDLARARLLLGAPERR